MGNVWYVFLLRLDTVPYSYHSIKHDSRNGTGIKLAGWRLALKFTPKTKGRHYLYPEVEFLLCFKIVSIATISYPWVVSNVTDGGNVHRARLSLGHETRKGPVSAWFLLVGISEGVWGHFEEFVHMPVKLLKTIAHFDWTETTTKTPPSLILYVVTSENDVQMLGKKQQPKIGLVHG